jgi:hypothetical protein
VFAVARALGLARGTAVLACGVFVLFANLSQLSREGSTPEKQLLLPMVLSYLAFLRGGARGLLVAGLCAGVAFLFKQTAVSIPLALGAWWLWQRLARGGAVRAFGDQGALRSFGRTLHWSVRPRRFAPPGPPA